MNKRKLNTMYGILLLPLVMFFTTKITRAQDIHFSQFYAAPLLVNPAFSGLYYGDFRITGNMRQQWKSVSEPYQTTAFGGDYQFYMLNGDRISAGAQIAQDESGVGNLATTQTYVVGAYHTTRGIHNLHGGLQLGYTEQKVSIDEFTFPNQFDRDLGTFNNQNDALPNNESNLQENAKYFDLVLGFAWSGDYGDFKPIVGLSIYHLNFPNKTLTENEDSRSKPRPVITGGGIYHINQKYYLLPLFKYMFQTKASDMLIGANLARKLPANQAKLKGIYGGLECRTGVGRSTDAVIFMTGLIFKKIQVGASYDINISSLNTSTGYKGATEFSLIYTGLSTQLDRAHIPCYRY